MSRPRPPHFQDLTQPAVCRGMTRCIIVSIIFTTLFHQQKTQRFTIFIWKQVILITGKISVKKQTGCLLLVLLWLWTGGREGGREGALPDIKQRMVCIYLVCCLSPSSLSSLGLVFHVPTWHNSNCVSALPALAWLQLNATIIIIIVIASCYN